MFIAILSSFIVFTAVMFVVLTKVAASMQQCTVQKFPESKFVNSNPEPTYTFDDFAPYPSDETLYNITVIYQDSSSARFTYLIAPGLEDEYLQKKICRSILVKPNHMYHIVRQSGNALLVRAYQM